ncbi:hypothetical protein J6Z48_00015 [bacterium]|nr:hypothetical protein [bacterium]
MEITAQQFVRNKKVDDSYIVIYKSDYSSRNDKSGKDGDIYVLFRVESRVKAQLMRLSKFVIDAIIEGYIYSPAKSTNDALKDAINDGVSRVRNMIRNDKDFEKTGIDVDFTIVLVKKEGLYIGKFGDSDIYVCKKDKCINVSEVMNKKEAQTAGIVLGDKDTVLVSTKEFLSQYINDISPYSQEDDFLDKVKVVGRKVKESEGLLYLSVDKNKKEKKDVETIIPEAQEEVKEVVVDDDKEVINIKSKYSDNKESSENGNKVKNILRKCILFVSVIINKVKAKLKIKGSIRSIKIPNGVKSVFASIWKCVKFIVGKIVSVVGSIFSLLGEKLGNKFRNKKWFRKLGSKISNVKVNTVNINRNNNYLRGVKVDSYKEKNVRNKRVKIVLLVLLIAVLLVFGINYTKHKKEENAISAQANKVFDQIEELLTNAQNSVTTDKGTAQSCLSKSSNLFESVPDNINKEDTQKLKELKNKLVSIQDELYKIAGVTEENGLSNFVDSRLALGEASVLTDIEIYLNKKTGKEYILLADSGKKQIYIVCLEDKTIGTIPNSNNLLRNPQYLSLGVGGLYIYDKTAGMLKSAIDNEGNFGDIYAIAGLSGTDIGDSSISSMITLTESDNIYFLSTAKSAILKSSAAYEDRYGLISTYIEDTDFSYGVDILSDLSLYIISNSATPVIRFSWSYIEQRQAENPVSITGIEDVGTLTCGYTDGESTSGNLYAFSKEGKRVLSFEKPMESESLHPNELLLTKQYQYRGDNELVWTDVKDIVVDSAGKFMYILEPNTVWKLAL